MLTWKPNETAGRPGNLAALFRRHAEDKGDVAHLCVDVQEIYARTHRPIAKHIAGNVIPEFRQKGIRNYFIHFSDMANENQMPLGEYAFCEVAPQAGEPIIGKDDASAFRFGSLEEKLRLQGAKILTVTGFSYSCCVLETARDATKKGFVTTLFTDCTNYREDSAHIRAQLEEAGVIMTTSREFFDGLAMAAR